MSRGLLLNAPLHLTARSQFPVDADGGTVAPRVVSDARLITLITKRSCGLAPRAHRPVETTNLRRTATGAGCNKCAHFFLDDAHLRPSTVRP